MKRAALYIGIPYTAGLMLASAAVRQLWIPVCGAVVLCALAAVLWHRHIWKYALLSMLSCLTACCVYWYCDADVNAHQLSLAGQEIAFTGRVTDLTRYSGSSSYVLRGRLDGREVKLELLSADNGYTFGDVLTLHGTPEAITSDYLYDGQSYARSQGIFLRFGYRTQVTAAGHCTDLHSLLAVWRTDMVRCIRSQTGEDSGALLTGLLFGDKTGMSRGTRTALYRSGIGHVMVVSGLHLDFLALCIAAVLRRLRAGRWMTFAVTALLCGLVVMCIGETVSVLRAYIMVLIAQSAALFYRRADTWNSLSIAMLVLTIGNPFVIHSASFWLSCIGAFGVGVAAPYMTRHMKTDTPWQRFLRHTAVLCWTFVVLLPVSAVFFREISLISPLGNLLLVPVCMMAMLLGIVGVLLGGRLLLAAGFFRMADALCRIVLAAANFLAGLPWTHAATGSSLLLPLLAGGTALTIISLLMTRSRKTATAAVLISLALTLASVSTERRYRGQDLRIALLGSGNACVLAISFGADAVLADVNAGSQSAAYAQAYCEENGVQMLEALILCDPDRRSISRYRDYLTWSLPEELWLMTQEDESFPSLPGVEPQTVQELQFLFHGAKITVTNAGVSVCYGGQIFLCTDTVPEEQPEILAYCGRSRSPLPQSGVLIVTDAQSSYAPDAHTYVGENNLEITMTAAGGCRIRRLYGNS